MKTIDVFGVGNALVDTLTFVADDFIREHDLNRGTMTLVDAEKQGAILLALAKHQLELRSGGSAANTMFSLARSGGRGFYTGKVSRDPNGEFYRQDLLAAGIHFDVHPTDEKDGSTGTCVVMTTPDAERTMYTHLGVSTRLAPSDINVDRLKECRFAYMEGYLWDAENPRKACVHTMEEAKKNDVKVSFTFSDPFCVSRYPDDFRKIAKEYCDVLFCNSAEAEMFADTKDVHKAAAVIGAMVDLAFITRSEKGCIVVEHGKIHEVAGFPVEPLDTNGAGDAFAGGTLFGLSAGYDARKAARWGNYLASCVVRIPGARLQESQAHKVAEILG